MEITLTTPALLFPAISLLLLAYTNRYLTLAGLIRDLDSRRRAGSAENIEGQIENLSRRIYMIRNMQLAGVISFFLCVATMLLLFLNFPLAGEIFFAASLLCLLLSLAISIGEIRISVKALDIQLRGVEK
ncbi:DUF2721 domain-containing protein [Spirochaeta isovalerica]|uniref:II family cellulose-binding protein n=1 Tax=Spirochaeta isovalerica TaxID=150 RepID=A0A841R673_9SPIO|nr:DUF2721 domain-containing protein [Spirochaeta isovalerica]MBB6479355.1 hypothetical protein [Spirochaeta isovalerica]